LTFIAKHYISGNNENTFYQKKVQGRKQSKHEKEKKKRVTPYLKVVKVAKRNFLEIYHKPEQAQQQHKQETRRKMPLVGYLDLVMNDKQRLLKSKKTHN